MSTLLMPEPPVFNVITKPAKSHTRWDYLDQLESESIHILREVAGQFERPALLLR